MEDPIETYKFNKDHSLIFHNSYLRLTIERYEIKDNNINTYLSLYKYKHSKWVLIEFFELIYIHDTPNSDFIQTKYCKIRIKEFYFETKRKWVLLVDIMCHLYSKETKRLTSSLGSRFNSVESDLNTLHVLLIKPTSELQKKLITKYLLDALESKDLFNEKLVNIDEQRNPFLIFSQFNSNTKELKLNQIDGRGRYSWNLPLTSPIFKFLRYLEGSYYHFLYPLNPYGFTTPNKEVSENIDEHMEISINPTNGRYGKRNHKALFFGVLFLKNLIECIMLYGPSDITYLQILFNDSVEDCIKLINDTISLFKSMYIDISELLKEWYGETNVDTEVSFTTNDDLKHVDTIMKNYNFDDKFDEIQVIIMNTWCRIFTNVNKDYYKNTYDFNTELTYPFETSSIDNQYFYKYYMETFKSDYLPTLVFKCFFDTLKINGLLIKDTPDEMDRITKLRNRISRKNIINICSLKNFNRCLVLYDDMGDIDMKKSLSSIQTIKVSVVDDIYREMPELSDQYKIKNFFSTLREYIELYLLFENIDQFLYDTEFQDLKNGEIDEDTESIENPEVMKLQYRSPLIEYYKNQLPSIREDTQQEYYYFGIYILLLFFTNTPSYTHILDENVNKYKKSNSPVIEEFLKFVKSIYPESKLDTRIFTNIEMTRKVGYNFGLYIITNEGEINGTTIIGFVRQIIINLNNIISIF